MMKKISRLFLRDGLRKLIALLLAVMLYFGIYSRITKERIISGVPVKVTLASELSGNVENITTNVTVEGSESTIEALTPDDLTLHIAVDQNNLVSGHTYVVIPKPYMFSPKDGVTIKRCGKITLHLQRVISRQLPVEVRYAGSLDKNFVITGNTAVPAEVTVTGPEDVVKSLRSVYTSEIPLSKTVFEPFEFYTKVLAVDTVKSEPANVLVQTEVSRKFEEREIKSVPVLLLSGSGKSNYDVSFVNKDMTVDIVVSGSPSAVASVTAAKLKPYVDASQVNSPSTQMLPVECSGGVDGIVIKSVTPGAVAVAVTEKKK